MEIQKVTIKKGFYDSVEDMLSNYNKIKQSMKNKDAYVEIFYNFNAW